MLGILNGWVAQLDQEINISGALDPSGVPIWVVSIDDEDDEGWSATGTTIQAAIAHALWDGDGDDLEPEVVYAAAVEHARANPEAFLEAIFGPRESRPAA